MDDGCELKRRSQAADSLEARIAKNVKGQEVDLLEWIFSKLYVGSGSLILELCSGTGSQTQTLLKSVGDAGQVAALDISADALGRLLAATREELRSRLRLIESDMDRLCLALETEGFVRPAFDIIFCAYGLYYSSDARALLRETLTWLKPGGKVVIIGPFGPNNGPLFELLRHGGVTIPDYVRYTSEEFMLAEVIPWVAEHFNHLLVHTMVNHVTWVTAGDLLDYWQNTTFYDPLKFAPVEKLVRRLFHENSQFVNEKWVMMIEAIDARP